MPAALWSNCEVTVKPDEPPQWIDDLADEVEIARLCEMGVTQHAKDFVGAAVDEHKLNTKFVRDWRLKQFKPLDTKDDDNKGASDEMAQALKACGTRVCVFGKSGRTCIHQRPQLTSSTYFL